MPKNNRPNKSSFALTKTFTLKIPQKTPHSKSKSVQKRFSPFKNKKNGKAPLNNDSELGLRHETGGCFFFEENGAGDAEELRLPKSYALFDVLQIAVGLAGAIRVAIWELGGEVSGVSESVGGGLGGSFAWGL